MQQYPHPRVGAQPPNHKQLLDTCMSTESDSDSDWRLLRNTLKGCQTFQNYTENRHLFPITITSSKSTL